VRGLGGVGIHIKGLFVLFKIHQTIIAKITNMKFHEHLSLGSQAVPCGQMDVMRLVVTFYNCFVNATKRLQDFSGPESEIL
jgi:hypothetical protein